MIEMGLEEKAQYELDYIEIQNLIGRYIYWHFAGLHKEQEKLFAKEAPDIRVEIANLGVYEGNKGIRRLYSGVYPLIEGDRTGHMSLHMLTNPLVEVARDGKTAKGLWISPGCETDRLGSGGVLQANWAWYKYGIDFVKETNEWKFWHIQVYSILYCPPDGKSWAEVNEYPTVILPDELKPDRSTTYHQMYSPTREIENIPPPPEPYETWDGKSMTTL